MDHNDRKERKKMKKIVTYYTSSHCPECTEVHGILEEHGINKADFEVVDITSSMKALREFIYFREANPAVFDPIKPRRQVGVPCFILEDGTITFNYRDVLE